MKPADISVWERFIDEKPDAYESVDYDVGLIQDTTAKDTASDLGIDGAEELYKYKIDVVGYSKTNEDIIELKDKANPAAVGQVSSYWVLYDHLRPPKLPSRALIICDSTSPDMELIAREHDIVLIVV